ncbi:MAG TPA: hypothetical protein VG365_16535, partial [Solirubrobacteraceae bacterium]|nr:hypothetical protein [Solirubrobacteraceae bacterium]
MTDHPEPPLDFGEADHILAPLSRTYSSLRYSKQTVRRAIDRPLDLAIYAPPHFTHARARASVWCLTPV